MRYRIKTLAAVALAAGCVLTAGAPAFADVSPNEPVSAYPNLSASAEVRSTMYLGVDPTGPGVKYFWASQESGRLSGQNGYFGLQTDNNQKRAIFSWWGALGVYCAGVPNVLTCGAFSEGGSGYQAVVQFSWGPWVDYDFRMWRGNYDSSHNAYWWNLDILADNGSRYAPVGALLIPVADAPFTQVTNFTEWFGSAQSCASIPHTDTWFSTPLVDGRSAGTGRLSVGNSGQCPAQVVPWNGGSSQRVN